MLACVYSAATFGVDANIIYVETNFSGGMPRIVIVGLPDRAVSESINRVQAAVKNSDGIVPVGKLTINLAPADIPKEGSAFDLPMAIGMMVITGLIDEGSNRLANCMILGELALDGTLRPVKGALPVAVEACRKGFRYLALPEQNAEEAAVVEGLEVIGFRHLRQLRRWLNNEEQFAPTKVDMKELFSSNGKMELVDFSDVRGQENVKRALEVAAAGGHNLIMVGPPGSGKTMMARRLSGILPPLELDEALETTKIHSVAGLLSGKHALVTDRPFRSPHHTVSDVALVGGGGVPMPGEISMAHNGVLFLDELPEFQRTALEVLRQPLEDGKVSISRARMTVSYPSRFMLVASMNPSPTGDWHDPSDPNGASPVQMQRYLSKISGPLLDRIDLHVEVNKVSYDELSKKRSGEPSASIRERVVTARDIQGQRFIGVNEVYNNAQMSTKMVRRLCKLDESGSQLLKKAMKSLGLSARAYDRILKVARTIADLDRAETILSRHIAEAIQYRNLDRAGWLG